MGRALNLSFSGLSHLGKKVHIIVVVVVVVVFSIVDQLLTRSLGLEKL